MRAALAAFGPQGGDIVNTASLAGLGPVPGYGVYAATKAGVVSISGSVDIETPRNVRVHAVCPDVVQTAMLTEGHTHDSLGSRLAHSGSRVLSPEEVADEAVGLLGTQPRRAQRPALARRRRPAVGGRAVGLEARHEAGRGQGEARHRPPAPERRCLTRSNTCSNFVHVFDRTSDRDRQPEWLSVVSVRLSIRHRPTG